MARFPYVSTDGLAPSLMPRLSMTLSIGGRSLEVQRLLDTGAAVNVLPYHMGKALGAIWDTQNVPVSLVGSLGQFDARALVVEVFNPLISGRSVRLVFAWTQAEHAPLIFGQMNFFLEFDVCFYRSQGFFEISSKL